MTDEFHEFVVGSLTRSVPNSSFRYKNKYRRKTGYILKKRLNILLEYLNYCMFVYYTRYFIHYFYKLINYLSLQYQFTVTNYNVNNILLEVNRG